MQCIIESVRDGIAWFNANQGFCMVLLTTTMVVCAILSYKVSAKATREHNRPHVVVSPCFIDHDFYFGVSLRNCGFSTAYNLNFAWDTVPISPWPSMATSEVSKFLREPIGSLRAGVGYKTFLGTLNDLKSQNANLIYRGKVTYNDSTGKIYVENIIVDFRMFQKHGIIPDDVNSDVVKALMRINEQLQVISRYADHLHNKERFAMLFGRKNQVHSEEKDNGVGVEAEKSDSSKGVGEA